MTQETLTRKLRVLRAERGLTLREAASEAGVRPATLSELERGRRQPHDLTLSRIAKAYGVPVGELIEEEPTTAGPLVEPSSGKPSEETAGAGRIAERVRALYQENPDRFGLIAVGSRDNWLSPLEDFPTSTTEALREVLFFLREQGWDLSSEEARLEGNKRVREAVEDVLRSTDELRLKRMKHAEAVFLAVEEDLVQRGVITREEADEEHRALFGTA